MNRRNQAAAPAEHPPGHSQSAGLDELLTEIRACRHCLATPDRKPLPHQPRPVLRAQPTARIAVCGQAPGTRVHASGVPFTDPSGDRLRAWMGVTDAEFYDDSRIAILPMGFCFPGLDDKGGDLPPRPECARLWRARLFEALPDLRLVLLVGNYAIRWHLKNRAAPRMTETVARWREYRRPPADASPEAISYVPVPHPSWRNNAWLKRHPWFEDDLLPTLRGDIRLVLDEARARDKH